MINITIENKTICVEYYNSKNSHTSNTETNINSNSKTKTNVTVRMLFLLNDLFPLILLLQVEGRGVTSTQNENK